VEDWLVDRSRTLIVARLGWIGGVIIAIHDSIWKAAPDDAGIGRVVVAGERTVGIALARRPFGASCSRSGLPPDYQVR
jgi:hypothetical protein